MAIDMILQEAKGMSDESLLEVLDFMRYIKISSIKSSAKRPIGEASNGIPKRRTAGVLEGKIKMADNFDDPLDEFGEYM